MRKLTYIILVLVTAVFSVGSTAEFPRFLLAFELLFAAVMFFMVRRTARRLEISLALTQKSIQQGERTGVQIRLKNPTWFPTGSIQAKLSMRDLSGWYEEGRRPETHFTVLAGADRRGSDCWQTDIQPAHCGLIEIQIEEIRIFDYIGLCSVRMRGSFGGRYLSVLPNVYPVRLEKELQQSAGREGWQEDVAAKPGSDTQEIFDTRFYQRGDTLHNIHWKLSAKADDLLVKEFSMPLDTAFYIVADCAYAEPPKAETMDHFLEMTAAVAGHCVAQNEPCELIWYSQAEEEIQSHRIERESDLYQALEEMLGIRPYRDGAQPDWNETGIAKEENEMLCIALDGTVLQSGQNVELELIKEESTGSAPAEAVVFDSAYIPDRGRQPHRRMRILAPFALLTGLVAILAGSFVSAFRVTVNWPVLLCGLVFICAFFTFFYLWKRLSGYRLLVGLLLVALYGGVCFGLQRSIINGFYCTAQQVVRRINLTYDGNLTVNGYGTELENTIFLLAVLFGVTAVLGASAVRRQKVLPVLAIWFPVLALTGIAGGSPALIWMYLILIGMVVLLAASRSFIPFWKAAIAAGVLAVAVSVPAWYLVRPLLGAPASNIAKPLEKLEMRLMQSLYQILPQISGGRLNLSLEGVGGGVEDGTLGAIDGYFFTGVEALRVTSEQMPMETVYLRGYIGQDYTGNSYEIGSEEDFTNAAASWKTEGNASIYVQNLPFLRMMYYENYSGEEEETSGAGESAAPGSQSDSSGESAADSSGDTANTQPVTTGELLTTSNTITVENRNANSKYTYVPYYSFMSDNYQIYGGDGYAGGQTVWQDTFPCYWRSSYKEAMEARRDADTEGGVLDRVEESYRAYCTQHDLAVPEEGLERLKEECEAVAEEEKWNQKTNGIAQPLWARADEIEEIRIYILKRLLSECEYELDADALPEGEDFIEYFLYETQEGYSMHFAAAATMMFRMFGVPARYVVGYVAPRELFSMNESGTYTAVLEDDNAHAWTEIYLPFLGWTPVEVTPGMEAEVYGDIYMEETESETETESEKMETDQAEEDQKFHFEFRIPSWLKNNLERILMAVPAVLALIMVLHLLCRIFRQRRMRLGLGAQPPERIMALYHSLYRILVLSGMPPEFTIVQQMEFAGWPETEPEQDQPVHTLLDYLAQKNSGLTLEELLKMQNMILRISYGCGAPDQTDADWMDQVYCGTWKALKKKISIRKKLNYLLQG